jgi:hypothetical protein
VSLGPSYAAGSDLVEEFIELSQKVAVLEGRFDVLEDWLVERET